MKKIIEIILFYIKKFLPEIMGMLRKPETKIEKMKRIYLENGGIWDKSLNIFGIRNTENVNLDRFNDTIVLFYKGNFYKYNATVDPSLYWSKPENRKKGGMDKGGAAHLILGYHKNIWKIGRHRNKYKALVQNASVTLWRDKNANMKHDYNDYFQTGKFGINLHHAYNAKKIGIHGAGCQVIQKRKEFDSFLKMIIESKKKTFSYLLIDKKQGVMI